MKESKHPAKEREQKAKEKDNGNGGSDDEDKDKDKKKGGLGSFIKQAAGETHKAAKQQAAQYTVKS